MFIVTLTNEDNKFWLHGTTWAFKADGSDRFLTIEDAEKALEQAKKFTKPAVHKKAIIEEDI